MFKRIQFALAAVPIAMMMGIAVPASADVAGFYKGRTVTIVVPGGLGASLGLYGRLLAEHWTKHIPGNPNVIVTSRPGGGGTKGAAYVYNAAPKDGTFVAEVLAPSVLAPTLRNVKFDATKFQWLGSITQRPSVVSVFHTAPATTLEGLKKTPVIMGSTGLGSETYLMPTLMNHLLGTKFKIVKGYKGGAAINKAIAQKEVHGRMNYWTGWTTIKNDWLKTGKLKHIIQYGPKIPELPNVPHMADLVKGKEGMAMLRFIEVCEKVGMGFWVAPGVPKDRTAALRKSFMATMRDPAFLADAKKRRAPVAAISGSELGTIVNAGLNVSPALIQTMKAVYGFK
ncbi:MAG: tripartite tricarboxylate transporter substrate-binding protein [Pseudomonadota bacterium]|nr:tripartite tricarboxylate transporter substrate-binding protein [Pseudomonadota bacterium]